MWVRARDWRAERQVGDRRRVDLRPAGVLDRHLQPELDGDVTNQPGARHAAETGDLERDAVDQPGPMGSQQRCQRVDRLVEHERPVAHRAHGDVGVVVGARLLEHVVEMAGGTQEPAGVGRRPRRVGIGVHDRAGGQHSTHRLHALDVVARIESHLDLDPAVARAARSALPVSHRLRRRLGHRPVQLDGLAVTPAQQLGQRHVCGDSGDIPRRHVESRLGVRMAGQVAVDRRRQHAVLAWIEAEHERRQHAQPLPCAGGERGVVEAAERRHLAPPDDAVVGLQPDERGVEADGRATSRAGVGAVDERLPLGEDGHAGDLDGQQ